MWRPPMFENIGFERSLVGQGKRYVSFNMCLTLRSLVSRFIPLLLGRVVCFQLQYEISMVLEGLKPLFMIGVENGDVFNQNK